jgi:hypothetical protein
VFGRHLHRYISQLKWICGNDVPIAARPSLACLSAPNMLRCVFCSLECILASVLLACVLKPTQRCTDSLALVTVPMWVADPDDVYKVSDATRSLGLVVCRGTQVGKHPMRLRTANRAKHMPCHCLPPHTAPNLVVLCVHVRDGWVGGTDVCPLVSWVLL